MKILTVALASLIALLQYPMWLGKGGWLRVWENDRKLQMQHDENTRLQLRNSGLDAEVRSLKQGLDAIEERARSELGMIRQDEVFFEVVEERRAGPPAGP